MRKWFTLFALLFPFLACQGQRPAEKYLTTPEDRALAEEIMTDLRSHRDEPAGAQMVRAAKSLLGQPYVAGTLEEPAEETLCIYLTRTDCILFVETCLGLVRAARQDGDFETLAAELLQSRYRKGKCTRYEDRVHYTTEWIRQGVSRGVIEDVSKSLGGVALNHPINYMSTHPDSYARMKDVAAIKAVEDRLNREASIYVPKAKLSGALGGIRTGDLIFFHTRTEGLDISHCGIALVEAGKPVRFIHASTVPMKVVVEPKTLQDYVSGRKSVTGIQVCRVR